MDRSHPRWPLLVLVLLAAAFENFWMWGETRLILGLPVNLAYHAALCLATSAALAAVVYWAWPEDTDD